MDSVHVFLSGSSGSQQRIPDLKLENVALDELSVKNVKEGVESKLGYDKQYQKLLWNGKVLQDNKTLGEYYRNRPIRKSSKSAAAGSGARTMTINLIATQKTDVEKVQQLKEDKLMRGFDNAPSPYVAKPRTTSDLRPTGVHTSKYGFGGVQALPNSKDSDKATALLEKLANDRGILQVMSHYHWKVGVLKEMPPDGKVGVDPVCVLGFNTNKGQEIHLRLRTDDLKGFRPWYKLIEVLCHELSHNIHAEHDSNFYALMRDIAKEQKEVEEKYKTGHRLDHRDFYEGDDTVVTKQQFQGRTEKLGSGPSSSYVHGNAHGDGNVRNGLAEAATRPQLPVPSSLSEENPSAKQSSPEGTKAPMDVVTSVLAESAASSEQAPSVAILGVSGTKTDGEKVDASESRNELRDVQEDLEDLCEIPTDSDSEGIDELNPVSVPDTVEGRLADASVSKFTLASFASPNTDPMYCFRENITDLCFEILTTSNNLVNVRLGVYQTFRQYIHNALVYPNNPKFRRISTQDQVFRERLGRYKLTPVVFKAVGFELDEARQEWVLKNYDPAVLQEALRTLGHPG